MKWTTFKFLIGAVRLHLTSEAGAACIALHYSDSGISFLYLLYSGLWFHGGYQTVKKNFYFIVTSRMSRGVEVVCAQQCEGSYYT
ncbi:hypothetical protein CsSME_00010125 [Camellia sinensis var. sinensis]